MIPMHIREQAVTCMARSPLTARVVHFGIESPDSISVEDEEGESHELVSPASRATLSIGYKLEKKRQNESSPVTGSSVTIWSSLSLVENPRWICSSPSHVGSTHQSKFCDGILKFFKLSLTIPSCPELLKRLVVLVDLHIQVIHIFLQLCYGLFHEQEILTNQFTEDVRSTVVAFIFVGDGCTAGGSVLMVVHKRFGIGDNALGLEILSSQIFIELLALEGLELTDGL
ncbi:hypothetical protein Acr_08g0001670 [Actinidia rufa]|uniref:Uncharacterized protein n=1 Tax=Actinidia rufa TaxID=165716 RepID=A0A7J0EZA9_9ERIC|nr:hypothetical protein Acr_08g0001670 [Actinidia rufa]